MTTTFYSVVTSYGSGQVIAEHFPSPKARSDSLRERAEQGRLAPVAPTADDDALVVILSTSLPVAIHLIQSELDADIGVYRPSGPLFAVV